MKKLLINLVAKLFNESMSRSQSVRSVKDLLVINAQENRKATHPNPLVRFGNKCFSQSDEDGITMEILRRIGLKEGTFIEFGVGDGTTNNSLVLLSMGWSGHWFGAQELIIDTDQSNRLVFDKTWITRDNIQTLYNKATDHHQQPIDLISLDLDGNDYHFIEALLEGGANPSVFIVEYNGKFVPPIEFIMEYNDQHQWKSDDYFGASLASFDTLFKRFGYALICCNASTGMNAFFVKKEMADLFPEVPNSILDIYSSPYYFVPHNHMHRQSAKTIELMIK